MELNKEDSNTKGFDRHKFKLSSFHSFHLAQFLSTNKVQLKKSYNSALTIKTQSDVNFQSSMNLFDDSDYDPPNYVTLSQIGSVIFF